MLASDIESLTPDERRVLLRQLLVQRATSRLSAGQRWLWTLQQLAPESPAYHFSAALRICSEFDADALRRVLDMIVQRHDAFRTTFTTRDGEPIQIVHDVFKLSFDVVDAAAWNSDQLQSRVADDAERPIDLETGPVFRATLFRKSDHDAVLLLVWHHIVLDGWSYTVVLEELGALYEADLSGRDPQLLPAIPYTEFVRWQDELLASDEGLRQRAYWCEQANRGERLEIVTDRARPLRRNYRGGSVLFALGTQRSSELRRLASQSDTTPFVVLLTVFEALLHRISGQNGVLISVPVNGRTDPKFDRTVGYFVNQVTVSSDIQCETTFRDLIAQTRSRVLAALDNQDYHLSLLPRTGDPGRGVGQSTGDVLFVLQKSHAFTPGSPAMQYSEANVLTVNDRATPSGTLGGMRVESFSVPCRTSRFDIELQMNEESGEFLGWLQFDQDLLDESFATTLAERYLILLSAVTRDADQRIAGVQIIRDDERSAFLSASVGAEREWQGDADIPGMFERQVRVTPNGIAAIFDGCAVTFRELDVAANRVAQYIRHEGADEQSIIGICIPRSLDMLVALLGIVKAGCTYLPLDPGNPRERLLSIARDSDAAFVITSGDTCGWFRRTSTHNLCLHCDAEAIRACPDVPPRRRHNPLLYVVYTSGSTGEPKGVLGTQVAAFNRFNWMWDRYPFRLNEVCAQITNLSFVDAVWEIFGPLLQGISIAIIPDEDVRDVPRLINSLQTNRASRITLVPSLLRVLLESNEASELRERLRVLQYWSCSGEALTPDLITRFQSSLPHAVLLNLYGCSEAGADSCCYEFEPAWCGTRVPIGRPISNTQIFLLDNYGNLAPSGATGEIHIGGAGLAAGYLNRQELTAQRFIPSPFTSGAALYRTGDIGRCRADGNIEFLGRSDHQLKIRGNRVEIGEVEAALESHPAVSRAAVIGLAEDSGDRTVVAYIVSRSTTLSDSALRTYLSGSLPSYMLPSHIVRLATLPLTSSGKIDRRALPPPTAGTQTFSYEAPRTEIERTLCELWAQTLNVPRIGVDDDFFEWGGHSILAIQLAARASKKLKMRFPVALLAQFPTVAGCSAHLEATHAEPLRHRVIAVRELGSLPPLFWIPGGAGSLRMARLKELADRLGPDQPFQALGSRRAETLAEIESIQTRAAAYVDVICGFQPQGPYYIAGFCLGGVLAFEVAQQLRAREQHVAFVGLVNTWMPADSIAGSQWLQFFLQRALYHARIAFRPGTEPPHRYMIRSLRAMQRMLRRRDVPNVENAPRNYTGELGNLTEDAVLRSTVQLANTYHPRSFDGKVHVFLSEEPDLAGVSEKIDPRLAWRHVCASCETIRISGGHDEMLDLPLVEQFSTELRRVLEIAQVEARQAAILPTRIAAH